jgi:thiol-disulfide isomerase/thioredoxin
MDATVAEGLWQEYHSRFKTADELWSHIHDLHYDNLFGTAGDDSFDANYQKAIIERKFNLAVAKFFKEYPADPRCWDAKVMQVLEKKNWPESRPDYQQILSSKEAPASARSRAAFLLIYFDLDDLEPNLSKDAAAELDGRMGAFIKEYPGAKNTGQIMKLRVDLLQRMAPSKVEPLCKELAYSQNPEVARIAQDILKQIEREQTSADLRFTAVDGKEVDLGKMRGKVVLLDFWATWCGPCRREIPNVLATYKKYHEKGFEVVGVSLDEDKQKMLADIEKLGMIWPQHFDGKGFENEIARKYGINAIPAMWLIDKKGKVRETKARGEELPQLVEKLLAE